MEQHTCERCSMDATYYKETGGITHYFCDHHKEDGSLRLVTLHKESTLTKVTPLLAVFGVIIALTFGTAYLQGDMSAMHLMMLTMAYFFLVFGLFKVSNLKNFAEAYMTYDVLAKHSRAYAYAYPFVEIALGVLYFMYLGGVYRDGFTFILMIISAYGVWKALQNKEEIPCACLGMVFAVPMTKVTLFENLAMAVMALGMIISYFSMGTMVM